MRVLVLYNEPLLPRDHPEYESEAEVLFTVEEVEKVLQKASYPVYRLGVGRDPAELVTRLKADPPDVVFNLFEGLPDTRETGDTETCVAGVLDWLGLPFTGSPTKALSVCRDKPLCKMILGGADLPTPEFFLVTDASDERLDLEPGQLCSTWSGKPLRWPLFVKLSDQDASVGIDQKSVAANPAALRERVEHLLVRFGGPVLVEEYIPGRELTVGVIELAFERKPRPLGTMPKKRIALPVSEFVFAEGAAGWPIVTYDAKWSLHSADYVSTPYRELADVPKEWSARLSELALQAFEVLGLRDYGRIDFRMTPEGEPFILEANPNPDLSPSAGLAGVLQEIGLSWVDLVTGLVDRAWERRRKASSTKE